MIRWKLSSKNGTDAIRVSHDPLASGDRIPRPDEEDEASHRIFFISTARRGRRGIPVWRVGRYSTANWCANGPM